MATIIKTVSFKNFYNYYGSYEDNTYQFKKGINFVNADNNGGKTKFFNGFLWLFFDKVYDQEMKSRIPISDCYSAVLSKKAQRETEGRNVSMGVKVSFVDDNKIVYTLEKSISFNDRGATRAEFNVDWVQDGVTHYAESDGERKRILDKLIPEALYNYALLQGEYMDNILDLSNAKVFTHTINTLSGIQNIDEIVKKVKYIASDSKMLLNKEEDAASANDKRTKDLLARQRDLTARVEKLKETIQEYKEKQQNAKDTKDELEAIIGATKERGELRSTLNSITEKRKRAQGDLESIEKSVKEKLFGRYNPWLFWGMSEEKERFKKLRDVFFIEKQLSSNTVTPEILLPIDSPDRPSLRRMLERKICEVCGRPFEEHSPEWNAINLLINRNTPEDNSEIDILSFVDKIRSSVENKGTDDSEIETEIQNLKSELISTARVIQDLNNEYNDTLIKFQNVGGTIGDSREANSDSAKLGDYAKAIKDIDYYDDKITEAERALQIVETQLNGINNQVSPLQNNGSLHAYQKYKNDTTLLFEIVQETKENIYNEIISALESSANEYYRLLTQNNAAGGGVLRFVRNGNSVKVLIMSVDEDDEMLGLGTGFQRMKQMAILMAIMQTQISGRVYNAPFIADAAFSEFSTNFIHNFISETPKVFAQEIILTKDTVYSDPDTFKVNLNELGKEIKDKVVSGEIPGTFYKNQPNKTEDQTTLFTKIIPYK